MGMGYGNFIVIKIQNLTFILERISIAHAHRKNHLIHGVSRELNKKPWACMGMGSIFTIKLINSWKIKDRSQRSILENLK